ncbi:hypothetical protein [Methylotenera sp.]|uniref:hypothetical protein n=1 Tax=Methylotenera sp. TaxID=2051956 RepID=UPI0027331F53|nr:hypothetical protein [Methylotenera sp.]MDP3777681.1 hypothetical protein [Methylotenera sp.]
MTNNVSVWAPKLVKDGNQNLTDFIAYAKEKLTIYSDQEDEHGKGWHAGKWKTTHDRSVAMVFGYSLNAYKIERLFEHPFMDFVKAFVRQEQTISETKSIGDWLYIFRILHDVLLDMSSKNQPSIMNINVDIQIRVEESLKLSNNALKKKYHYGGKLEELYKWLVKSEILPTLPIRKNPFPRGVDKIEQLDEDSIKWSEGRCPSMHQMLSLADCFAKAESTKDRFYTSVLVLLCFAPSRGSEINSLTINSLQQEEDGKFYVMWYSGKGYGDIKKWIPTVMVDIVKEAFKRLIKIGALAREAAKYAFDNPDKFMRHKGCVTEDGLDESNPLTCTEFLNAMSMKDIGSKGRVLNWGDLHQKWIKKLIAQGNITYLALAKLVNQKYQNKDWPKNLKTGRPVWENLCLIREYEFSDEGCVKIFSWVSVSVNQINDQLGNRIGHDSTIWQRFGIKDEDGSEISLTSHQLRVWLNTHAMNGGMSDYQLAMWSGRADIRQNRAYDGRTKGEKDRLKNQIMEMDHKSKPSLLALFSARLPVALPILGVQREGVADFTGLGFCVHNFAQTPCTKSGECITCKEHVCIKGLPETLENLEQMELLIAEQLEKAKLAATDLTFGADRWVTHLGWKLVHIRAIIEKMKNPDVTNGALIRIPVTHDPSPTRRALNAKGQITELNNTENSNNQIKIQLKLLGGFSA